VRTDSGRLDAEVVVRATEGYTPTLEGHSRKLIPIHTMMIATEPLPQSVWDAIGLAERETFGDPRRIVIYGQRTADGRLAFGSRGEYYFGSGIRDTFPASDAGFVNVQRTLTKLFPGLRGVEITHRWGGPIGVPRDWRPSVGLNRRTGFAWAGGYVGEGVAASNLAGRTLADLILDRETELVELPWVGRPFPKWEREPMRWAGVKAIRALAESVDSAEFRTGETPKLRSRALRSLAGDEV
jgi:glycine/D-amino acid oxidase-like deaminating enzyme